mgnify:CR=1 FL=1
MVIATSLLIILVLGWLVSYMTGYMLRKRSQGAEYIYGFRAVLTGPLQVCFYMKI